MIALGTRPVAVRNVRIAGPTRQYVPFDDVCDVVIQNGRIADFAPVGALKHNGPVWDAEGSWVMPGLWDHHIHASPTALASMRTDVFSAASAREAAAAMSMVAPSADGRRIGVRMRDGLWPERPTLALLDESTGSVATYVINMDLHSVWMNSAAFLREGIPATPTGLVREEIAFEVSRRLGDLNAEVLDAAVSEVADRAAARGIVGMIDYDFGWNLTPWVRRAADGFDAVRVQFGIYPHDLARAIAQGLATGDAIDELGLITVGSLKAISDGSLGTRTAACSHPYPDQTSGVLAIAPEELLELMTTATGAGFACAIHAIGDVANSHALDAFQVTGAWGSIEHAQLVSRVDLPRFARVGVSASVQPTHAVDDRDLADREWAHQPGAAYPLRSLHDAGANLLFGSDSPVAPLDPWLAIANAVERTADDRDAWLGHERVDVATALAASVGGSQNEPLMEMGDAADLVFCAQDPYTAQGDELRHMTVNATLLEGRFTHLG